MKIARLPFLSLDKASFRLGDRLVFEDTSWIMHQNEHWAITGPNGSGKSLLGDALRGRLPMIKGELAYGFDPEPGFTAEDCIGHMAFEDRKAAVHEQAVQARWHSFEQEQGQSVRDALSYESVMAVNPFEVTNLHKRQRAKFERRRRTAVHLLGLKPLLDRKLIVLSNGETQKVQLARVLSLPLRLLILDEPFIGLDRDSRRHFGQALNALMAGPLRVILITANAEFLPRRLTHLMQVADCKVLEAVPILHGVNRQKAARTPKPGGISGARTDASTSWRACSSPPLSTPDVHSPGIFKLSRRFRASKTKLNLSAPLAAKGELVRLRNVTVKYGRTTILRNVNWTVRDRESWALLGPNGSGKTTLLSLILGDHPQAYANDIAAFGRRHGEGQAIRDLKQRIGWVSPELQVHFRDSFTCLETVESGFEETIGLYEEPTATQRRAALRWLKRFGLKSFADTPLFELSAGLQRSVLLARALVKRPKLLILDEPCQGLDERHQRRFLEILDPLLCSGKETAIYVTHRVEEIPSCIRRVLRLKQGHAHPGFFID